MIDFIQTTLYGCKGNINFTHLGIPFLKTDTGWEKYYLDGCERLIIAYNPNGGMLRLEGSISYYWQGHNFSFTKEAFFSAINHINKYLGVNLWHSTLNAFEYGVIVEVDVKPKEYIKHHSADPKEGLSLNERGKDKGMYRSWEDKFVKNKMYDAGRNIKYKQDLTRQQIINDVGWNVQGEYLKFEVHYLKPEKALNKGKGVILANLCNPTWESTLKEDCYIQYKRLIPMKSIIMPQDKKMLSTSDILAMALVEGGLNGGASKEEVKKLLYAKINCIPENILSKSDKDARKRQVKNLLANIQEEECSKWDLSNKIVEALDKE